MLIDCFVQSFVEKLDDLASDDDRVREIDRVMERLAQGLCDRCFPVARLAVKEYGSPRVCRRPELRHHPVANHQVAQRLFKVIPVDFFLRDGLAFDLLLKRIQRHRGRAHVLRGQHRLECPLATCIGQRIPDVRFDIVAFQPLGFNQVERGHLGDHLAADKAGQADDTGDFSRGHGAAIVKDLAAQAQKERSVQTGFVDCLGRAVIPKYGQNELQSK